MIFSIETTIKIEMGHEMRLEGLHLTAFIVNVMSAEKI